MSEQDPDGNPYDSSKDGEADKRRDAQKDAHLQMIKNACEKLGEHFDTVHIFSTRHEPAEENGTLSFSWGIGNWFARKGHIEHWVAEEEESTKIKVRKSEEL